MLDNFILIAEDNETEVALLQREFQLNNFGRPHHVVADGEEVIAYLKGSGRYARRQKYPLPNLLLLDLRMPRKDGFEVLEWIREQPFLDQLRVIVLTGSEEINDVNRAYKLGADSFMVKPLSFTDFMESSQSAQRR